MPTQMRLFIQIDDAVKLTHRNGDIAISLTRENEYGYSLEVLVSPDEWVLTQKRISIGGNAVPAYVIAPITNRGAR